MDKDLILKYVNKTASEKEKAKVLRWAAESMENEKALIEMMNTWVSEHMPQEEADDAKYQEFGYYLHGYNASAAKNSKYHRINVIGWSVAVAAILLLLCWNLFLANTTKTIETTPAVTHQLAENITPANHIRTLYTDKGVKARITLPDSSTVWLNSDTRIEYPEVFDKHIRNIKLSGEAYFEVKSDSLSPMIITTSKGFQVKVTGTTFNIKAYDDDEIAQTTLYSGSISLLYKNNQNVVVEKNLKPRQSVDLSNGNTYLKANPSPEELEVASMWKMGKIYFDSTPLGEAIKILNRWHGSQFIVKDAEILDYEITANFENESIVQIMELIKLTTLIDYSISSNKITLIKR